MKYNQVFEHRLKNQIIKLGRAVINVVVFATVNWLRLKSTNILEAALVFIAIELAIFELLQEQDHIVTAYWALSKCLDTTMGSVDIQIRVPAIAIIKTVVVIG
jgi:hypothetical protein